MQILTISLSLSLSYGKTTIFNYRTSFTTKKIRMTVQSVNVDKSTEEYVTSRGLTLFELSRLATHHSEKVRKDSIEGVSELIEVSEGKILRGSLRDVLDVTASTFSDQYRVVRKASRDLLRSILQLVEPEKLVPFQSVLSAYLGSALSSLKIKVRVDAVATLRVILRLCPSLLSDENLRDVRGVLECWREF